MTKEKPLKWISCLSPLTCNKEMEDVKMETTVLKVEGMSCEHCVKAVTNAVGVLPGVSNVSVDLKGKTVTVQYDPAKTNLDKIHFEIEDQGYEVIA